MLKTSLFVVVVGVLALLLSSCISVHRPDLPKRKGYEAKQSRILGFFPLPPHYDKVTSKSEMTRREIRLPAKALLWAALPTALIAFAASIVLQTPVVSRKLFYVAAIAAIVAIAAAAWLLATISLWVFGAIALLTLGGGGYTYWKMEGKGVKLKAVGKKNVTN